MSVNQGLPSDHEAERAFLGSMIVWPSGIGEAIEYVVVDDLHRPTHQSVFSACAALYLSGQTIDAITVYDECRRRGDLDITQSDVITLTTGEGGRQWKRYADIIIQHSLRRRMLTEAYELQDAAHDLSLDPAVVLDQHRTALARIDTSIITREPDDISVEEFLERPSPEQTPWVIGGIIRRGWRCMIVGGEGLGKSSLIRQLAELPAYGLHPLRFWGIPKIKVLIVDLENPEDALWEGFDILVKKIRTKTDERETVNRLWHRPGGMDLRNRASRAELEAVIAKRQPDLVVIGPMYKAYSITARDGFELPAREVQQALDSLRVRYGFALILEDHAPQASGGAKREIRPYGSSFWLRWPEIGIGLTQSDSDPDEILVSKWRGDRAPTDWPKSLVKHKEWPFEGIWQPSDRD